MNTAHVPVLLNEVIHSLSVKEGGVYVDGTFGAGGYTKAILDARPNTRVLAIDRDQTAIDAGQKLQAQYNPRLKLILGCFGNMSDLIDEKVDGIVLDIGVSSMQIDQAARGFSFQKSGPLDMRMGQTGQTAADVVNTYSEDQLADIIYIYGEEKFARKIAHQIVSVRKSAPFENTLALAQAVHAIMPHKPGDIDSATRTFQALRIYVNDELGELERALNASVQLLKKGGILSVVTFHSLEDRIVKDFFVHHTAQRMHVNKYKPQTDQCADFELLYKKPIVASAAEVKANPRSRSAHLRSAVFMGEGES